MNSAELNVRETAAGVELHLHVLPRAKRCELSGIHNGALKVRVTAPPVDDAANRAIIEFFSTLLHISKSSLAISTGLKSRHKILQIKGLSLKEFRRYLDAL
jgi:uncharacterized protein (TIGR00251 family)